MDQIAKVTVEALDQESIAPMVFELKNFIMSQHRCSDAKPVVIMVGTGEDSLTPEQCKEFLNVKSSEEVMAIILSAIKEIKRKIPR